MVGVDRASRVGPARRARVLSCEDGDDGALRVEIAGGRRRGPRGRARRATPASGAIYPKAVTLAAAHDAARRRRRRPRRRRPDLVALGGARRRRGESGSASPTAEGVRGGPARSRRRRAERPGLLGKRLHPAPPCPRRLLEIGPSSAVRQTGGGRDGRVGLETSIAHLDGTAPMWCRSL